MDYGMWCAIALLYSNILITDSHSKANILNDYSYSYFASVFVQEDLDTLPDIEEQP